MREGDFRGRKGFVVGTVAAEEKVINEQVAGPLYLIAYPAGLIVANIIQYSDHSKEQYCDTEQYLSWCSTVYVLSICLIL